MDDTRSTLLHRLADRSDDEAWSIFDRVYRPMLVGYARTRGFDQADAEDVSQQTIEQVVKHVGDFEHRHPGSFKAWLRSIAENKIRDRVRKLAPHQAASGILTHAAGPEPDPAEAWEQHWLLEHLRYCVERVRPDIAENTYWAFYYHVIEDVPVRETAERLNITANQVYVAKFRVLERIRTLLTELTGVDLCTALS